MLKPVLVIKVKRTKFQKGFKRTKIGIDILVGLIEPYTSVI